MEKLTIILLSLVAVSAKHDIEKISGSILRNGTEIYQFFSPNPRSVTRYLLKVTAKVSGLERYVLGEMEPAWAVTGFRVDADPDINYLGENQVRLYFEATEKGTGRSAIGVAQTDSVEAALQQISGKGFSIGPKPLMIAKYGEYLSHPSLYQAKDGSLQLFYQNSTRYLNYVSSVGLSRDGLRLLVPQD